MNNRLSFDTFAWMNNIIYCKIMCYYNKYQAYWCQCTHISGLINPLVGVILAGKGTHF